MGILNNYSKSGKGVDKFEYESRTKIFFDVLYRKFWDICKLNILYCLFSAPLILLFFVFMPSGQAEVNTAVNYIYAIGCMLYLSVVGLGFVIPGFTYVLRNYSDQTHAFILSDFWDNIKSNFKQGILLFIIDSSLVYILYIGINFYSTVLPLAFAKWFLVAFAVFYFMMHFYIYQIMITFDMSLWKILVNSFILTIGHLPKNILVLILSIAIAVFTFSVSIQFGFFVSSLVAVSLIGYIVNFTSLDTIKKYMVTEEDLENLEN